MVQISAEYLSNERKRTNRFFIHSTIARKPETFRSKLTFRVVGIDAVFFERMPTAKFQSECKTSGIILKKIASIGVWGNGRFPQLNLPSALAVAKQGYSFLFA